MGVIKIIPLGAGQDVGRSCIIINIGKKNIMLDCGMHMGYNDERRFPDFSFFTQQGGTLDDYITCVILSHFHLDHCGALPYMSEVIGYNGPIYMTHPTKAICPILLEDYRRILVDRKGHTEHVFTSEHIKSCMKKVIAVNLHECIKVEDDLYIKPYYAGHVLGAAMFLIKYGDSSVLYTGDFNMTADRHLGTAKVDKCRPSLLITESTYATTVRDSKRCREAEFLKKIHECVENGGKVLIPVFALGRAQELCILLESYWERMNIKVPIYFTVGLAEKANYYYRMFISWTNEKIKKTFVDRNMFDFKHIKPFQRSFVNLPSPMVVFATPGMLHSGQSLAIFKQWAPDPKNMVILPGYCVYGTVGQKILSGVRSFEFENNVKIDVRMTVEYMSFSAHADAKGILQLIRNCEPANVLLVHGEGEKMKILANNIRQEFDVPCYYPANGELVTLDIPQPISVTMSKEMLQYTEPYVSPQKCADDDIKLKTGDNKNLDTAASKRRNYDYLPAIKRRIHGTLVFQNNQLHLMPNPLFGSLESLGQTKFCYKAIVNEKILSALPEKSSPSDDPKHMDFSDDYGSRKLLNDAISDAQKGTTFNPIVDKELDTLTPNSIILNSSLDIKLTPTTNKGEESSKEYTLEINYNPSNQRLAQKLINYINTRKKIC